MFVATPILDDRQVVAIAMLGWHAHRVGVDGHAGRHNLLNPTANDSASARLLLVGGGHAHIEVLARFAHRRPPGWQITLVTPLPWLNYSGMLPSRIAGHYSATDMQVDLARLAARAGADFLPTQAIGLNADAQTLALANGQQLHFDIASLDIGSAPAVIDADAKARVIPVKPVETLLAGLDSLEQVFHHGDRRARLVVVGGGAGGVELALSLAYRLRLWRYPPRLSLATRGPDILKTRQGAAARRLRGALARAGVEIIPHAEAVHASATGVRCRDGREIPADAVFCATGAEPPAWLSETGLATSPGGFIAVDEYLSSRSHPTIFAAGDIASLPSPRPKSGVYAIRQAPTLAHNLAQRARNKPLRMFRAQRHALALVSLGQRRAIAMRGRWALGPSACVWWIKDQIDRRFMTRYQPGRTTPEP